MIGNLSAAANLTAINYPYCDSHLPFTDYIKECRNMIAARRPDLQTDNPGCHRILDANSPYELLPEPAQSSQKRRGALLIHGLLDCPYSLRDIGNHLQQTGVLCRSVLLPGHGTMPSDLLHVTYHDWIQVVRYGVESLKNEVDQIYLIGYSTGAALAIYQALQDIQVEGIVLLSPAIRIKAPVDIVVGWRHLVQWMQGNTPWAYVDNENDYTKYHSVTLNAVTQVSRLTDVIHDLRQHGELMQPMLMIMSREDETVSSHQAIHYFSGLHNPDNKMLIYSSTNQQYPDPRIVVRPGVYPALNIRHLSHTAIPFSADNEHYGQHGDYPFASRPDTNAIYGAYNKLEVKFSKALKNMHLLKSTHEELTYNPDFEFMMKEICQFIAGDETLMHI